jgi:hypothetical protein
MEMLHQQVQRKKEKMARLADLQRQIDEATEEVRHLAQDEQECWGEGEDATLHLIRYRTKTCDEVVSSRDPVQNGGPRVIRPIVTGPAWPLCVTGLICKGLPVITICNPALWEYSRDNLGV